MPSRVLPFGALSTITTRSSLATRARSFVSPRPSTALPPNSVSLANKLQVLALVNPAALQELESEVDRLLAEG